jgi:hypothetical protein
MFKGTAAPAIGFRDKFMKLYQFFELVHVWLFHSFFLSKKNIYLKKYASVKMLHNVCQFFIKLIVQSREFSKSSRYPPLVTISIEFPKAGGTI